VDIVLSCVLQQSILVCFFRSKSACTSLLLPYLLNQALPFGFFEELLAFVANTDSGTFRSVLEPLLHHLVQVIRSCSMANVDYKEPLTLLAELSEFKVDSSRVVCSLVSKFTRIVVFSLVNFLCSQISRFVIDCYIEH
jgi:hypothetical protein